MITDDYHYTLYKREGDGRNNGFYYYAFYDDNGKRIRRSTGLVNEKKATRFISAIKELAAEYNCCVLIIHHTGVDKDFRSRGSSVFKGALDSEIQVTRKDDEGGLITVTQTKNRARETVPQIVLQLEKHGIAGLIDDDTGELKENAILVPAEPISGFFILLDRIVTDALPDWSKSHICNPHYQKCHNDHHYHSTTVLFIVTPHTPGNPALKNRCFHYTTKKK